MMGKRAYRYSCDGGSICIGNGQCRASFPNGYGDGTFKVTITDTTTNPSGDWKFCGCVEGTDIMVLDYDCYGEVAEDDVICHLSGRYGVYSKSGNILLDKWD